MPEEDTNVLEVLIGQMGQRSSTNPILGKALGVLGHAELFEPVRDPLHWAHPSDGHYGVHGEDI
jgi:hypothetical protein